MKIEATVGKYVFPFIFFIIFYTLFCSLSQNELDRQDVPFVAMDHICDKRTKWSTEIAPGSKLYIFQPLTTTKLYLHMTYPSIEDDLVCTVRYYL